MDNFLFDFNHEREDRDVHFESSDSSGISSLYPRLLVMVGDEPWAQDVVTYAVHRAARTGAEAHFLSVLTTQIAWGMSDVMAAAALDASIVEAYNQYELAWAAAATEAADVPYTTRLRWGNIPATIRQTAKTAQCELIVMGPHIRTGCEPLSGRYLARRVAVNACQPVLVVPQAVAAARHNVAWQRILVVIDGSAATDTAVEQALRVAQEEHVTLCLLQVTPARRRAAAQVRAACTLAAAQTTAAGVAYDVQQATGDMAAAILKTAAAQQCDLVLLGIPARNGWPHDWRGCPAKAVLDQATVPVLLIPSA
jgi:nucleotide-binding universal stress UspA family protein